MAETGTDLQADFPLLGRTAFKARAFFVGERIDLRLLETTSLLASRPMTIAVGEGGCAVLFRYGAVVLFAVPPLEEAAFFDALRSLLVQPFAEPESEEIEIRIAAGSREGIKGEVLTLQALDVEQLQLVAESLARSVVLDRYEKMVAREFDTIEPLAESLRNRRYRGILARDLLQHIGSALLGQHMMVGRVELTEKPDLLWENPALERLYLRLEDEFEIKERHHALEQKMAIISRTAETILDLIHTRRTLRVEWYIVILIVVEILLTLYELFVH